MKKNNDRKVIIFGASGAIGNALIDWFNNNNFFVYALSRNTKKKKNKNNNYIEWLDYNPNDFSIFEKLEDSSINSVVWAQGENLTDNIYSFDVNNFRKTIESNVSFILITLQILLNKNKLKNDARLCIISSIWQKLAKQDKLSYTISKSALQGAVMSLAVDLGKNGMMINAVLPGVIDTPMTLKNLSEDQIKSIKNSTPLKSLASLEDVSNIVGFLCSESNKGITGEFIRVDKGFSNAKII